MYLKDIIKIFRVNQLIQLTKKIILKIQRNIFKKIVIRLKKLILLLHPKIIKVK